jgi:arylsulfatase A-like enzyme
MRLPESVDTLAEILSELGYDTAAFVSNSAYLTRLWGFDQGFRLYDDRGFRALGYESGINALLRLSPVIFDGLTKPYRPAERLNQTVFRWLDSQASEPFFLFVNYMEPHEPYAPPSPYDRMFDGRDFFVRSPAEAVLEGTRSLSAEEKRHFDAVYDGEVAYCDAAIGSLLDRLVELGLFDDSLIIVTSDHGEFLGEHDLWGHGYGPYDPVHRVPLLVKLPRAREQRIVKHWVQTTDIFPTVLRALSIPIPDDIDGQALPDADHPVVIEQPPNGILSKHGERFLVSYRGIYDGPWKLIAFSDGSKELYNIDDDPLEITNLISERPEFAAKLMVVLTRYLDSIPRDREIVEPALVDEDAFDQLRALGYLR